METVTQEKKKLEKIKEEHLNLRQTHESLKALSEDKSKKIEKLEAEIAQLK